MPFQGNNRTLARNIRKKEYNFTAPRVRRVFFQFASLKTTEAMHLMCLKKQRKRGRKTSYRLRDHQGKGKLVWSRVEIIRENISGCGIVYRNR